MYADTATDKQVQFIEKLLIEKELDDEQRVDILADLQPMNLTRGRASATIDFLLTRPRKIVKLDDLPDVPEGRYAINLNGGPLKFYRVDREKNGRTFVHPQGGPTIYPSLRDRAAILNVLETILMTGVQAASQRYGQELGHCGACGLPLTDEESRSRGIGPVCWGKKGWL